MSLKNETVIGIKWQVGMGIFHKALSVLTTIIIARRLGPSVYGLFALAMIIVGSFELFKSMGIDAALVRKKLDFKKAANTAFFIIPILGISLYLILNLAAPFIGKSLNNNDIISIIRVLGIVFVFSCFSKVPTAFLEINMQFRMLSIVEFCSSISFSVFAIAFTFLNLGVWALVYAYISKVLIYLILIWTFAKWKPTFEFSINLALEMFNFGKFIFLGGIAWFIKMNLDNFLVGKLLGITMLGFYAVAFNISNLASDYIGKQIGRVMFPAYSQLIEDQNNFRKAFLKALKYVSLFGILFGICLFFLGGDFIRLVYGIKWLGAIPVLGILVWAGVFNFLSTPLDSALLALGKSKIYFLSVLIQVVLFFIFIAPAASVYGLKGVAIIVVIASAIAMLVEVVSLFNFLRIGLTEIILNLKIVIVLSLILICIFLVFSNPYFEIFLNVLPIQFFILKSLIVLIILAFCLFFIENEFFDELRVLLVCLKK